MDRIENGESRNKIIASIKEARDKFPKDCQPGIYLSFIIGLTQYHVDIYDLMEDGIKIQLDHFIDVVGMVWYAGVSTDGSRIALMNMGVKLKEEKKEESNV